jgi:DNA recombination protein RmuC
MPSLDADAVGLLRPDMIVSLPNGRRLIVDAKAPLDAYLRSLEVSGAEEKSAELARHAQQIRTHISRLASKQYWKQFEESPDFVILFLPGEAFFSAALEQDPELIQFGVREQVILATPTTLIALLKAVAYGWQQQELTRQAREISRLGKELYERLSIMAGHFKVLGKHLDRSVESYNQLLRSTESRLLVTARKLQGYYFSEAAPLPEVPPVERLSHAPLDWEPQPQGQACQHPAWVE